jgi:phosphodiesterase/alkaline phosphatase D-like protein
VAVGGLEAETEYHYRVLSGGAVSANNTFTTAADDTAPVISSVASGGISATTVSITWNTNEMTTSQVVYSTTSFTGTDYATGAAARTAYGSFTAEDATRGLGHGVGIVGLSTSTTYYYRAVSKDGTGNETVSTESSFTTLADTSKPAMSDIRAVGVTTKSAIILWLTNEMATTQVYYDTASHAAAVFTGVPGPNDYASSTQAVTTLSYGHGSALAGLAPNTTYYYRTVSKDANDNGITSAEYSFTTQPDSTAPEITSVMEANIGATSAIVLWLTSENATSNLVYDVFSRASAGAYALSAPAEEDATADNMNHGVAIAGLTDATIYYYRVISEDGAGNQTVSAEYSFTSGDVTAPALSGVSEVAITDTAAGIVWSTDEDATTQVVYSTTSHSGETYADSAAARLAYGTFSLEDTTLGNVHGAILTGLTSGNTYYYRVISRDGGGNETISDESSFATT